MAAWCAYLLRRSVLIHHDRRNMPRQAQVNCQLSNRAYINGSTRHDIRPSYIRHGAVITQWIFFQNPNKNHPIARPWGRDMGFLLWARILIDILPQLLQCFMQYDVPLNRVIRASDFTGSIILNTLETSVKWKPLSTPLGIILSTLVIFINAWYVKRGFEYWQFCPKWNNECVNLTHK